MSRRTKLQMVELRDAIVALAEEHQPCTVRQIYYLGVGRWWEKDQGGSRKNYKMVVRMAGELREDGTLPWGWIADNTRWFRQRTMFSGPGHILQSVASTYRRDLWERQPRHVEVWCESDSIAGVCGAVSGPAGLALFPCRGQSSKTLVYEAAQQYMRIGKPVSVLYVGDHDPSGLAIPLSVEDRMARYHGDDGVTIELRRIAVTTDDVASGTLTTHSVNTGDSNYRRFLDHCRLVGLDPQVSVEVEALPPQVLRDRLNAAIDNLIDPVQWNATLAAERSERDLLARMVAGDVSAFTQVVAS